MEILKHFIHTREKKFIIFSLKDDEWNNLCSKLPEKYKSCFISDKDLEKRIKTFSSTKEKELCEILPTKGNIKSGDFGEILAYFLFKELYKKKNISGPKKWRWKEAPNTAAPYSDVVLFSIKNGKYSKDDLLISVESKMKATRKADYSPIKNAIAGAKKDHVYRLANSLTWLREKYKRESLKRIKEPKTFIQLVNNINRFIQSEKHEKYIKQVNAIAFVDKTLFCEEKAKSITIPTEVGMNLKIYLVGIKNLKGMYENTYSKIPKL